MSPRELASYARVCQKHGIRKLRIDNVEMELELTGPSKQLDPLLTGIDKAVSSPGSDGLDEEAVLFWSSQGPPGT